MKRPIRTRVNALTIAASMVLLISSHTANAQNVGIGTPTPGSKLSVAGNAVIGSGYASLAGPTDGLAVQGNVGIGTTTPAVNLHVLGIGNTWIRLQSTNPPGSIMQLGSVISNGRTESQLQFQNMFSFVSPLGGSILMTILQTGNVGIGTPAPAGDAGLDINFTDKGLLIPRVSLTNTGTYGLTGGGPTTSMLVYNTNAGITGTGAAGEGYYYWNGTRWAKLLVANTPSDAWLTLGNAGTTPGTHFIGTTDNVPLDFRVNNTQAGHIGIAGDNSVFFGLQAGFNDDGTDNRNTFIGTQAGYSNTGGYYNTASGYRALYSNTTGSSNTAIGTWALYSNTTGSSNTASGYGALYSNTTGSSNTAIGTWALGFNTTAWGNTAIGYQALYSTTTGNGGNTAVGYLALYSNTTGYHNTACGRVSLYYNTTGEHNTAIGEFALYSNTTGNWNTASGVHALYSNTTGSWNTASGMYGLFFNTTGNYNASLGYFAGYGASGVDFNQCTFVGANSYPTVARTNVTMLGYGITNGECTGDNQVLLGNTAITQIRAAVSGITTYSDKRFKTNIAEDVIGLDFITRLRPVSFNENPEILHQIWGTPDSLVKNIDHSQIKNTRFVGLIAQEVEQAMKESGYTHFTGIDVPHSEHEVYSIRYTDFIMPLIKSVQELNEENIKLKAELDKLTTVNEQLTKNVSHLQIQNSELRSQNTELKSRLERIEQMLGTMAAEKK